MVLIIWSFMSLSQQTLHLAFQPMYLTMLFNARHRMQPMCKQLFGVQKALNNCLKKVIFRFIIFILEEKKV